MPRWVSVHSQGRSASVDADRVVDVRPVDPANANSGSLLTLRGGDEMQVDEAVQVIRLLPGRAG